MINTYDDAIKWMEQQKNSQPRVGLEKINHALAHLNFPQKQLKVIQVVGTNGKGSVCAYLTQLMLKHHYSVGTFTSPHIMKWNERIRYNNVPISDEDVIKYVRQLKELNDYMARTEYGKLVFFELYTVLMVLYFKDCSLDICIIEAGIGGLNDCTNIFEKSDTIITTIDFDHIDKLGNSIESIAFQKAGIIKENGLVWVGRVNETAQEVIQKQASQKQATYHCLLNETITMIQSDLAGNQFEIYDNRYTTTLIGKHQIDNAALAILFFKSWCQKNNYSWDEQAIYQAIEMTQWMGRLEKVCNAPDIYLDGAHNVLGLSYLLETISNTFDMSQVIILYSGLLTKNQVEHYELFEQYEPILVYTTSFRHSKAITQQDWEEITNNGQQHSFYWLENWQSWLKEKRNQQDKTIVVTGSLYFVAQVREFLIDN